MSGSFAPSTTGNLHVLVKRLDNYLASMNAPPTLPPMLFGELLIIVELW